LEIPYGLGLGDCDLDLAHKGGNLKNERCRRTKKRNAKADRWKMTEENSRGHQYNNSQRERIVFLKERESTSLEKGDSRRGHNDAWETAKEKTKNMNNVRKHKERIAAIAIIHIRAYIAHKDALTNQSTKKRKKSEDIEPLSASTTKQNHRHCCSLHFAKSNEKVISSEKVKARD